MKADGTAPATVDTPADPEKAATISESEVEEIVGNAEDYETVAREFV